MFNLDLSDKDLWKNIKDDVVWYKEPTGNKIWISLSQRHDITNFTSISFDELQTDFNSNQSPSKQLFGYILYTLVATKDTGWIKNMAIYKTA